MKKNKKFESKGTKVTDREVTKWTGILGAEKMVSLFMEDKISLTPEQVEKVIEIKNTKPAPRQHTDEFL